MGILDQIIQLKSQGYEERDIIDALQQRGASPKDIMDAINQANIKNAVSNADAIPSPTNEGGGYYTPQTQQVGSYQKQPAQAEYYEEQGYTPASTGIDSDTIIEIANQIFSEKIRKTEKRVEDIDEIKAIMQVKVNSIDERLKKIEKIIDTLQVQILEKVGSYGKELESTQKEVSMLEDTLGKTILNRTEKTHIPPLKKIKSKKRNKKLSSRVT